MKPSFRSTSMKPGSHRAFEFPSRNRALLACLVALAASPGASAQGPNPAGHVPAAVTQAQPPLAQGPTTAPARATAAHAIANPLAPLDTSSPRATLQSFRDTVDAVAAVIRVEGAAAQRRPETRILVRKALSCLDLSEIAPSLALSEGSQAAVCLKEILDRIPLPADADIPDAAAVQASSLKRWRLPGTEIFLVRIADGNREGDFVFAADSVTHAERFYERIRGLPYRADAGSPGLLESYVEAGGWMIPEKLIKSLPRWAHAVVMGETVWQWTATLLVTLAAAWVAVRMQRLAGTGDDLRKGSTASLVFPAAVILLSLGVDYMLSTQVRLTGDNLAAAKIGLRLVTLAGVVGGVLVAMSWLSDLLIQARGMRPEGIDSQLIRLGGKVLTFLVVSWIVIQAADSLGIPAAPLVAGLGAGGLALALASQYTVENLIAGLVIFADKPVRIGDECKFGDVRGRVEQIGLRSTRIRGEDRSLVTVPNAEFAKQQLVNFSQRDHIPLELPISLPAGLPPRAIRDLLGRIRDAVQRHPQLETGSVTARLTGQGTDAVSATVSASTAADDDDAFAAIREDVLLVVMETVAEYQSGRTPASTASGRRAA